MDFRLDKYLQKDHFSWFYRTSTNIRPRPWRVVRLILLFGLSSSPQVSSTLPGARPPAKPWRQGPSRGGRWHRCRKLVPSSWHILELGNQNHPLLRAELGSLPICIFLLCRVCQPKDRVKHGQTEKSSASGSIHYERQLKSTAEILKLSLPDADSAKAP